MSMYPAQKHTTYLDQSNCRLGKLPTKRTSARGVSCSSTPLVVGFTGDLNPDEGPAGSISQEIHLVTNRGLDGDHIVVNRRNLSRLIYSRHELPRRKLPRIKQSRLRRLHRTGGLRFVLGQADIESDVVEIGLGATATPSNGLGELKYAVGRGGDSESSGEDEPRTNSRRQGKECFECQELKPRTEFTGNQFRKRSGTGICKMCQGRK